MKKISFFIFGLLLLSLSSLAFNGVIKGFRIDMNVCIIDDEVVKEEMPQGLTVNQIPTVSIDGNILYFYDVFSTTVPVFVVDASDNVVFSATLYPGEDKKVLPASLSGTYTLYMRVGTIMYYGNIII